LFEKCNDITSFGQRLSFDECEILKSNQDYLRRALNIKHIDIRLTNDTTMLNNFEDIVPGKPLIHFHHE
ncbi:unnamed protein product, partial [Rotaria magnacalcarata]